jgi:hypothetical protein
MPDGTYHIALGSDQYAIVDEADSDLDQYKWRVLGQGRNCYAVRHTPTSSDILDAGERMHRVILARILGRELSPREYVDHADGNGLNNQRNNIRLATPAQNSANQRLRPQNTSGFKGVTWHKRAGKWCASIGVNRKSIHLGLFEDPEEAHRAYMSASQQYFGEFANDGNHHSEAK